MLTYHQYEHVALIHRLYWLERRTTARKLDRSLNRNVNTEVHSCKVTRSVQASIVNDLWFMIYVMWSKSYVLLFDGSDLLYPFTVWSHDHVEWYNIWKTNHFYGCLSEYCAFLDEKGTHEDHLEGDALYPQTFRRGCFVSVWISTPTSPRRTFNWRYSGRWYFERLLVVINSGLDGCCPIAFFSHLWGCIYRWIQTAWIIYSSIKWLGVRHRWHSDKCILGPTSKLIGIHLILMDTYKENIGRTDKTQARARIVVCAWCRSGVNLS